MVKERARKQWERGVYKRMDRKKRKREREGKRELATRKGIGKRANNQL